MDLKESEIGLRLDYDDRMCRKFLDVAKTYEKTDIHSQLIRNVKPTGSKWGRRIADVGITGIPKNLVGMVLITHDSQLCLVFGRWDREEYLGWEQDFTVSLSFSDGRTRDLTIPSSSRLEDGHSFTVKLFDDEKVSPRVSQVGRSIPRILWNISTPAIEKRDSHEVRRLLRNIRFMTDFIQCTSLYIVLDEEACQREIDCSGIKDFAEAYHLLRPGSYKADLMRYFVLYRYGGVYVDDKSTIRQSLDSDAFDSILVDSESGTPSDMFIGVMGWRGGVPEIAFMGARPGSPIMLKALETSIDNIMHRRYNDGRLGITGSTMLKPLMEAGVDSNFLSNLWTQPASIPDGVGMRRVTCWGENVALLRVESCYEKIFYGSELVWHRQSIPFHEWPKATTYYWNLWNQREVYTDGNPEAPLSAKISKFLARDGMSTTIGIIFSLLTLSCLAYIFHRLNI